MYQSNLKYGVLSGLIVGIPLFTQTVIMKGHPPLAIGMLIGYLTMLVAFSLVFIAIKRHRDTMLGGVIRFWPAFLQGLAISLVASVIYVAAWEAALAVTGIDFAGSYSDSYLKEQAAKGVTGEALAKMTADMESFKKNYANPFYRLPMTLTEIFPVGVLVSAVSAGLLRNPKFFPAKS